jgi:hypothetical protein
MDPPYERQILPRSRTLLHQTSIRQNASTAALQENSGNLGIVIPAKAGTQDHGTPPRLDTRLRGYDGPTARHFRATPFTEEKKGRRVQPAGPRSFGSFDGDQESKYSANS